jgi:hypothetical protein
MRTTSGLGIRSWKWAREDAVAGEELAAAFDADRRADQSSDQFRLAHGLTDRSLQGCLR